MAIFKNQSIVSNVVAVMLSACLLCTPGFSVSAQTVSDENSTNTETQVSEELILPNGDTLTSNMNSTIDVVEAVTVNIKVGTGDYKKYNVPQGTVKEALDYANIKLGKNDTVNESLASEVEDGAKIKVDRVKFKTKVKTKKFNYKTVKKKTSGLYVGQKKVVQKGKAGTKKLTYTKKVVNGKVEKTVLVDSVITKKAVKKVVKVGTKRKNSYQLQTNNTRYKTKSKGGQGTFIDIDGKKVAYKKKITGQATAYSANPGALTSVGDRVHIGGVAVNPRQIPYGSKLYIETTDGTIVYGYAVANDTGGFATAGTATVDLFYNSTSTCIQFGRRMVNVYILA